MAMPAMVIGDHLRGTISENDDVDMTTLDTSTTQEGTVLDLPGDRVLQTTCASTYTVCSTRPLLKRSTVYQSAVVELQSMLNCKNSAGLTADGYFGTLTETAVKNWQTKYALSVDGIVGTNTWNSLCSATTDKRACKYEVTAGRTGLVTLLNNLVASGKTILYSQDATLRWSGIKNSICPVSNKVPTYADCSSFVSWVFWTAYGLGEDKLNGQTWAGGYTGTMASRGVQVSKATTVNGVKTPASYANAQPGDIVLYGPSPHVHVAIYVGNGKVANYGSTGPVKILPINFHSSKVEQIRSVIGSAVNQF